MSETEQRILDAAKNVFIQKGFAAARMQEIADEAGINKALLHYYFRSKKKLFRMIVSETIRMIIPKLSRALEHEGPVLEKFDLFVETYIETIMENPHMPTFMMMELSQGKDDFIAEIKKNTDSFPNFQGFVMQVFQEIQAGTIREVNPFHLLLNVLGMCVFPFIAKPIFTTVIGVPNEQYQLLMQERKKEVKSFIRHALTPA